VTEAPLAVTDLGQAAEILKANPEAVLAAAQGLGPPHPYRTAQGDFWSIHALAMALGQAQGRHRVKMNREDAEAAAVLYESTSLEKVATAFGTTPTTLHAVWTGYGIETVTKNKKR
jgi:hypothetical protein